jgi:hypothetical protein
MHVGVTSTIMRDFGTKPDPGALDNAPATRRLTHAGGDHGESRPRLTSRRPSQSKLILREAVLGLQELRFQHGSGDCEASTGQFVRRPPMKIFGHLLIGRIVWLPSA